MIEFLGITIGQQSLVLGLVTGLTYAAFAAGFVLIYRSTGVLNFAHGEVGAFGVALFVLLLAQYSVNWWLSFLLALAACAAIGMAIELIVIRRLFNSPRLVVLIATIGVGQIVLFAKFRLPSVAAPGPISPPFKATWTPTDHIRLQAREIVVLVVVPVLIAALAWFIARTRFGLAVRASASNADTARVYGTSPRRTSTIVWSISGAFAAATAIFLAPLQGINSAQAGTAALAEPLLLRVLVVSLLARMRSLPGTLIGGVGVGVAEQLIRTNVDSANRSVVDVYLFLAVLVVVLLVVRNTGEQESWSLAPRIKAIPSRLESVWWVRRLNAIGFAALFGFFVLLGLTLSTASSLFTWTSILLFAMVALSMTVLTGWAGQLSLGQYAFVGLGGLTVLGLTQGNDIPIPFNLFNLAIRLPWAWAMVAATVVGVVTAVVVGLPALRVRGLFLAVTTLAFAVASATWLFNQEFFTGGTSYPRPAEKPILDLGPIYIDFGASRKNYYFLCLVSLAVVAAVVARLRRTGIGRSWIAVRDNEEMAAASTVSPTRMKLVAFGVAGGIAAYSGGLLVTLVPSLQPVSLFRAGESIVVVATAIIGGLGSVAGPILGALWVRGIPQAIPEELDDLVRLLTSSIGLLVLLMYFPGGLLQIIYSIRDKLLERADRRMAEREAATEVEPSPVEVTPETPETAPERRRPRPLVTARPAAAADRAGPALQTRDVSVRFGGNVAVDHVSVHVDHGELVGLIGTNGAGKSTLLNAISGFVPAQGRVSVLGTDVTGRRAPGRHALGLGRGFQGARIYPGLTVRESLMVALEARSRSYLVPSMTALPPSPGQERAKRAEADEIIAYMGLKRYADHFVATLSTGTRRIVELSSLLAVNARVLLLDEPTGGVAQREAEAFGPLIKQVQAELDAAVIVIEHDMPLVMGISDRVYCLEAGAVIAEGTPEQVRQDSLVIASYLGTSDSAIGRSGPAGS
ncbi:MAG: ATP-binding cassette domain-containing protein [Acidimicrobiaceae bacterium]|nr:branched-chain amino acid ABC transporter permease/ATP-binding protein [Acidimicrobiaceae bacterium]MCY3643562.1 branched-chain amino acid ABC transporter permease/ATP-binding protein [Acidimicrobiaceae bacterium]MDE0666882.1 branched-chain amino acid ABC transporter permease/ATP-binding protein [Acidimicrobiaceae bacterium]MXY11771.1 ATP-binding cassette domain-containing protein [Acidimicrobiaceae bacterium]MXZ65068.1 ATP-binding cassette domain-containing protein [Acidimicrobiaceae bacter